MKIKEEGVNIAIPATDDEITDHFENIRFIEPSLEQHHEVNQKILKTATSLKKFLDHHCSSTKYLFHIKKCTDMSCYYCQQHPIRMQASEFASLSFIPLPTLLPNKEKYAGFDALFGTPPDEKDCPSSQKSVGAQNDEENKSILVSTKVRATIVCGECTKPRAVYAKSKLTVDEQGQLTDVKNSWLYTCGSSLFPPTSPLHNTMVVRQNITCESPVESQYYSATLVHFPPVCYWCGGQEETLVLDDEYYNLRAHYQTVRAICFFCKAQGKSPFTRHPLNSAKRPRKS